MKQQGSANGAENDAHREEQTHSKATTIMISQSTKATMTLINQSTRMSTQLSRISTHVWGQSSTEPVSRRKTSNSESLFLQWTKNLENMSVAMNSFPFKQRMDMGIGAPRDVLQLTKRKAVRRVVLESQFTWITSARVTRQWFMMGQDKDAADFTFKQRWFSSW
jgi:hypothetical protein